MQRRPWPAFAGGLAILIVLAIPLLSMRLAFPDAGGNPTTDTTRRAYDLVADGFGPGFNGPLILAAEFPKGADTARARQAGHAARRARADVAAVVAAVAQPVGRRGGDPGDPAQLAAVAEHDRSRGRRCATT